VTHTRNDQRGRAAIADAASAFGADFVSGLDPSTAGTLRDPNNFGKKWRTVREDLGVPEVTTHSFRKTVATLIDDEGLSARIGADHLGHTHVSMTRDRYMDRGRVHPQVAELLDRTIKNDE